MNNKVKKPREQELKRAKLTAAELRLMMAVIIRNVEVFSAATQAQLDLKHFNDTEMIYRLTWQVVSEYFAQYEDLPLYDTFVVECQRLVDEDVFQLTDEETAELDELATYAFSEKTNPPFSSSRYEAIGLHKLRLFVSERLIRELEQRIAKDNYVVEDLPGFLSLVQQKAESVVTLGRVSTGLVYPDGWDTTPSYVIKSTGCDYFDHYMRGGHVAGEAHIILAPYGGGKTITAIQLCAEACKTAKEQQLMDGKKRLAVYVTYEARLQGEVQYRALSYAARISKSSIENMGKNGLKALSTSSANLKDYEKKLFATELASGFEIEPELARANKAIKMLNESFKVFDMTGNSADAPGAGNGFIAEITTMLRQLLRKYKNTELSVVVVDYLGASARRYQAAKNLQEEALQPILAGAMLQFKNKIATEFNVPVWVLHQLNAEANEVRPGKLLKHTKAAECRTVAENADFAFMYGTMNHDHLFVFGATKARRTAMLPPIVLRVDGDLARITYDKGKYDVHAGSIVESKLLHKVAKVSTKGNNHNIDNAVFE